MYTIKPCKWSGFTSGRSSGLHKTDRRGYHSGRVSSQQSPDYFSTTFCLLRDWSLITGRGGATKWENRGSETFCAPPQDSVKLSAPPPFKEWKLSAPPLQYGSNFKLQHKNYPKTYCAPPSEWPKLFPSPLFVGVKLHVPPLPFCSPPSP